MKLIPKLFAVAVAASAIVLGGCSKKGHKESSAEIKAAAEAGMRYAGSLPHPIVDTVAAEAVLIDFRERLRRLRQSGYPKSAAAMEEAFFSTLDSINPPLARQLQ